MRFSILLSLLLSVQLFAANASIDFSSTNLGQTYATSSVSLQSTLSGIQYANRLCIQNKGNAPLCAKKATSGTVAPSSTVGNDFCALDDVLVCWDMVPTVGVPEYLYLRCQGATCNSGKAEITWWQSPS